MLYFEPSCQFKTLRRRKTASVVSTEVLNHAHTGMNEYLAGGVSTFIP